MTTGKRYDFLLKQMKERELKVESQDSANQETIAAEKEKASRESRVETEESRVKSLDSASQETEAAEKEKVSLESRVETEESRVKSLDSASQETEAAEKEKVSLESRVETEESGVKSLESARKDPRAKRKKTRKHEARIEDLDSEAIDEAIEEAKKRPKLGIFSPIVAAVLRYRALTTPRYSMGLEMRTILEQALKSAYPELYEEILTRMSSLESRQ